MPPKTKKTGKPVKAVKKAAVKGASANRKAVPPGSKSGTVAKGTRAPKRSIQDDLPVCTFHTAGELETWMQQHHREAKGLWLRLFKKGAGTDSLTRKEALDVILCFGWIDHVANKYDDQSFLQRFTPRRPKSLWSRINIDNVERLIKEGRMQPAGLREIEAAKADGRWALAYDPPSKSKIPDDFLTLVRKNKAAWECFQTLNKTNQFAIAWRLQTAKKPETRTRRMEAIITMLSQGKKFH